MSKTTKNRKSTTLPATPEEAAHRLQQALAGVLCAALDLQRRIHHLRSESYRCHEALEACPEEQSAWIRAGSDADALARVLAWYRPQLLNAVSDPDTVMRLAEVMLTSAVDEDGKPVVADEPAVVLIP